LINLFRSFYLGWLLLPLQINFEYAFANASYEKNSFIYLTVISIVVVYILFALWARLMDRRDLSKCGVAPLPDNNFEHNYFYEIVVYTGSRWDAATDSLVCISLFGERTTNESIDRVLKDTQRKAFRRGGVDSFLMSVAAPLGHSL
jgi:hypothetical protein